MYIHRPQSIKKSLTIFAAALLFAPYYGHGGTGTYRVVDEDDGTGILEPRGLIDLTVAVPWNPDGASPDWTVEELERQFRTASVILCDATEGRFRIANVRFVYDPGNTGQADVYYQPTRDGSSQADVCGLGKVGTHADMAIHDSEGSAGGVLAHELGHYLLCLKDEYPETDKNPCGWGAGFHDPNLRTEVDNTIMDRGVTRDRIDPTLAWTNTYQRRGYCHLRIGGGWLPGGQATGSGGAAISGDDRCFSTEDCADWDGLNNRIGKWEPADWNNPDGQDYRNRFMGGADPIWGQGSADNVVCMPIMASELSLWENFDTDNGLPPAFDRRTPASTSLDWGIAAYPDQTAHPLVQLDAYLMGKDLTPNDHFTGVLEDFDGVNTPVLGGSCAGRDYQTPAGAVCLEDCPLPEPTHQVNVSFSTDMQWGTGSSAGTSTLATPEHSIHDYSTLTGGAVTLSTETFIYDPFGIWDTNSNNDFCDQRTDSRRRLLTVLQYFGYGPPNFPADTAVFMLSYALPTSDTRAGNTSCFLPDVITDAGEIQPGCQYEIIARQRVELNTLTGDWHFDPDTNNDGNNTNNVGSMNITIPNPPYGINECYRNNSDKTSRTAGPGSAVPATGWTFQISTEVLANLAWGNGIADLEAARPADEAPMGNCAWYRGQDWCAKSWQPFAPHVDLQQGTWASTRQSVEKGVWGWRTVFDNYKTYKGQPFVTQNGGPGSQLFALNEECLFYQARTGSGPVGAYDVNFTGPDYSTRSLVSVLMDTSGSMGTADGANGITRYDEALNASYTFLNTLSESVPEFPAGSNTFLLWNAFDSMPLSCPDCVPLALFDPVADEKSANNINSIRSRIDSFKLTNSEPSGCTRILDSLYFTGHDLYIWAHDPFDVNQQVTIDYPYNDPFPPGSGGAPVTPVRTIYLITDGYDTASEIDITPEELSSDLRSLGVEIVTISIGADNNFEFFRRLAGETGGGFANVPNAAGIIPATIQKQAEQEGGNMIQIDPALPAFMTPVESTTGIGPISNEPGYVTFDLEEGCTNLTVLLTRRGYGEGEQGPENPDADTAWNLGATLQDPDGRSFSRLTTPEQFFEIDDRLAMFNIKDPKAGPWELFLYSGGDWILKAYFTATVVNPNVRFVVDASPKQIRDGDQVVITPSLYYSDVKLDINRILDGAESPEEGCTGIVYGPHGFREQLAFENTQSRAVDGEDPTATLKNFNGRGYYRVELTCHVPENAPPAQYKAAGTRPDVPEFTRTASTTFFYDSPEMPVPEDYDPNQPYDFDGDTLFDEDECEGDPDQDGWPSNYDDDSDNDEIFDNVDNCPCVPNYNQADSDNDDIGDACEITAGGGDVCVFGKELVFLGDRVDLEAPGVGSNQHIDVGSQATVQGDLLSAGNATLYSQSSVLGDVYANAGVVQQAGAVVDGVVSIGAGVDPSDIATQSVEHNGDNIVVSQSAGCAAALTPAVYGTVTVQPGCTLTLESGVFSMRKLTLEPDAILLVQGPVALNLQEGLAFADRGRVLGVTDPDQLRIYSNQTGQCRIGTDSVFAGLITAPHAEVIIASRTAFDGCVHARIVRMEPDVSFTGDSISSGECGNGVVDYGEECDDGNDIEEDGCTNRCERSTCYDGILNGNEVGTDCGGPSCPGCPIGGPCLKHTDCESLYCSDGVCVYYEGFCGNGVLDDGEECDDGNGIDGDDCLNDCTVATCDDGVHHQTDETGIDCGGVCPPCGNDEPCVDDDDCESQFCDNGLCTGTSVDAEITLTSSCPCGYCASVQVTNVGDQATISWTVTIDPNDATINWVWNGNLSQAGGNYVVTSMWYNGAIAPGGSASFSYCASKTGPSYLPVIVSATAE